VGPEWIVVAVVAVAVIFGAKKIPEMARSLGRAQGEFKKGLKEGDQPDQEPPAERKPADPTGTPEA
jgi:sec-independent protein translocase protein TatA